MGKPWENHGKPYIMVVEWDFMGIYPPVIKQSNMACWKLDHLSVIFLLKRPFIGDSPLPCLITRGYSFLGGIEFKMHQWGSINVNHIRNTNIKKYHIISYHIISYPTSSVFLGISYYNCVNDIFYTLVN